MNYFKLALSVCFICILSIAAVAQNNSNPHELQGFLLGQRRNTIEKVLGKPLQVQEASDGWVDVAFQQNGSKENYLVFSFAKSGNEPAAAIQYTGAPTPGMRPFLGLRLGDSVDKVVSVAGKPSLTKASEEEGTLQYDYEGRNFSFEIDTAKRLSSIRISDTGKRRGPAIPNLELLRAAASNCNIEELLNLLSGDLEVYRGKESLMFERSAVDDLSKPGKMREAICGNSRSLKSAFLAGDALQGDPNLRITEKGPSGPVIKFPESKTLKEIFFKEEAGEWRVYEIQFR
jgi:hypothetical protein